MWSVNRLRDLAQLKVRNSSFSGLSIILVIGVCVGFGEFVKGAEDQNEGSTATLRSPLSPAESLRHFRISDELRIEIVAAEPEVIDPVSIAFDETGTLWVVEMTDYPNGPQPGQPPMSRIRKLTDGDGDGRFETSSVFVDKLLFATGVQPWKGGLIVTLAGEVAWFQDRDGDGHAEVRQTWFKGFAEQNPQLRANHPRFGLDLRVTIANGLRGGTIIADPSAWGKPSPALPLNGFDFRFNPLTGVAEAISGVGQFGLTFDDYGRRFVCSNRNPCRQILLENNYLARNPLLAIADVGADVSPSGAESRVYPISRAWTTSTQHAGQFTAACGVQIYRGTGLPQSYYGNSFTCEPTGNLVHRDVIRMVGTRYVAESSNATEEFLSTADEWFRPVDLANGPDGALYVVDMYRAVIEHPEWVPTELKNRPDERDGSDRGRIYRIVSKQKSKTPFKGLDLAARGDGQTDSASIVQLLSHSDSWQRDTATRLLFERQDSASIPLLESSLKHGAEFQRLHAYMLLSQLKSTTFPYSDMLSDRSPRVREQGLRLVEPMLIAQPDIWAAPVIKLTADEDSRVRFQAALTLSAIDNNDKSRLALAKLLLRDARDEWTRRAVLIAIGSHSNRFFEDVVSEFKQQGIGSDQELLAILPELTTLCGATKAEAELGRVLRSILDIPGIRLRISAVTGFCQGIQRSGGRSPRIVLQTLSKGDEQLRNRLASFFNEVQSIVVNSMADETLRLECLAALGFTSENIPVEDLLKNVASETSQAIVIKSIEVLSGSESPQIEATLMNGYSMRTPAVRRAILRLLLRTPVRTRQLLNALSERLVSLAELDPGQVKSLTQHSTPEIRQAAQTLLSSMVPQDRKQVLEHYQKALTLAADPQRGRLVFEKNCATCHRIGNLGTVVGPDIADSRVKTPQQLLSDILNPNQAIDNNYVSYTVVTKDGRSETGFIATETASSITLRQPENKTLFILRQDLEELKSNGVSLMPEGLEKNVSLEQMADLISFIKNWRYLDGQVPIKVAK